MIEISPDCNIKEESLLNKIITGKNGIKLFSRLIEEKDMENIVQIVNWAYRGKNDIETWTTEKGLVEGPRLTLEMLKLDLESDQRLIKCFLLEHIVYESDNVTEKCRTIVGCVRIDRESLDSKESVLGMLSVDPEYQSKGIGGVLVKLAESEMKSSFNATESHLHVVNVRDELLSWYHSLGYIKMDKTYPFIVTSNVALKPIHFSLLIKKL